MHLGEEEQVLLNYILNLKYEMKLLPIFIVIQSFETSALLRLKMQKHILFRWNSIISTSSWNFVALFWFKSSVAVCKQAWMRLCEENLKKKNTARLLTEPYLKSCDKCCYNISNSSKQWSTEKELALRYIYSRHSWQAYKVWVSPGTFTLFATVKMIFKSDY